MTPLPDRIAEYAIARELGRGGMGVVYLAHDPNLDREVAIMVLPADVASSPEQRQRLERRDGGRWMT